MKTRSETEAAVNGEWMLVSGVVVRGHQVASGRSADSPYPRGSIEMQVSCFRELGLDLTCFFPGTLNILISPYVFAVACPAITFRGVVWTSRHPPEDFSFSCCRVIFESVRYDSWVYYPHPETKVRHFHNPSVIEVVAPRVPNIGYGSVVGLEINTREIVVTRP